MSLDTWRCDVCGYTNPGEAFECGQCGELDRDPPSLCSELLRSREIKRGVTFWECGNVRGRHVTVCYFKDMTPYSFVTYFWKADQIVDVTQRKKARVVLAKVEKFLMSGKPG